MDGDCDLLLIETSQDMLEVKAAVMGVQDAFARTGRKIPVQALFQPAGIWRYSGKLKPVHW